MRRLLIAKTILLSRTDLFLSLIETQLHNPFSKSNNLLIFLKNNLANNSKVSVLVIIFIPPLTFVREESHLNLVQDNGTLLQKSQLLSPNAKRTIITFPSSAYYFAPNPIFHPMVDAKNFLPASSRPCLRPFVSVTEKEDEGGRKKKKKEGRSSRRLRSGK